MQSLRTSDAGRFYVPSALRQSDHSGSGFAPGFSTTGQQQPAQGSGPSSGRTRAQVVGRTGKQRQRPAVVLSSSVATAATGTHFHLAAIMRSGRATHRSLVDDPYLAARHLRVFPSSSGVGASTDTVNGVFGSSRTTMSLCRAMSSSWPRTYPLRATVQRRARSPRGQRAGVRVLKHSTRIVGRLRQLTTAAVSRDIWHVSRPEILLGREEGDIGFPTTNSCRVGMHWCLGSGVKYA